MFERTTGYKFNLDPGGTPYPFSKEINKDEIIYQKQEGSVNYTIVVPKDRSYYYVEANGKSGAMMDAYYNGAGELYMATIYLLGDCDGSSFDKTSYPDKNFLRKLKTLRDTGHEVILEADLDEEKVYFCRCGQEINGERDSLSEGDATLPFGTPQLFRFFPNIDGDNRLSFEFSAGLFDNVLSLGFLPNSEVAVFERFSTQVNFESLGEETTEHDLSYLNKVIENIFVRAS